MNKIFSAKIVILIALLLSLHNTLTFAQYSGGDGSSTNPYKIANAQDWQQLMIKSADWSKYFILTADVNLANVNVTPIGNLNHEFIGTFDGNDHTISNVTINSPTISDVGVFGAVAMGGQIRNLTIQNGHMVGDFYTGGLIGSINRSYSFPYPQDSVLPVFISNCYFSGQVEGRYSVGGLIGGSTCSSFITLCSTSGTATGLNTIGGLIGTSRSDLILACSSSVTVTGLDQIGGFAGQSVFAVICNSYSSGSVFLHPGYDDISCGAGGFIGDNEGNIKNCYSVGLVDSFSKKGGFAGDNYGYFTSCFWNIETSGLTEGIYDSYDTQGLSGKTTAELKNILTFTNAGWDFVNETANGINDYWKIDANEYPVFENSWNLNGQGTEENPYKILSLTDLGKVWLKPSAIYQLQNNLDLAGTFCSSAIIPVFSGIFNGQGFIISNYTINDSNENYLGFWGYIAKSSKITHLGLEDININGNSGIGSFAGRNLGTLTYCYATGQVSGTDFVGGLTGKNCGDILSSYTACSVTALSDYAGGLVGYDFAGTISGCYSSSSIRGQYYAGGIAGVSCNACSFNNCYSIGAVNCSYAGGFVGYPESNCTFKNCFWDIQTSGKTKGTNNQSDPIGLYGKTTPEMKTTSTFVDWNCNENVQTGNDWILQQGNYPILAWQIYEPILSPDLKGLTISQAQNLLNDLGIELGETYLFYDLSVEPGLIAKTNFSSATYIYPGLTKLNIFIAKNYKYNGGDGTILNPYKVSSSANWQELMAHTEDWNKIFIMMCDINLDGINITPVGNSITKFTGTFDGNDHIVSNVIIDLPNNDGVGLFGCIQNAQIKNLGIKDVNITGRSYVGGLTGSVISTSNIAYCNITNCFTAGKVKGFSNNIGGLVGYNDSSSSQIYNFITTCYSNCSVSGTSSVGGLIGYSSGIVSNSYATGSVSSSSTALHSYGVGGLVGDCYSLYGSIRNCYATGSVSSTAPSAFIGGLVGNVGYAGSQGTTITDCYATGSVSLPSNSFNAGGLVGYTGSGKVSNCYSKGIVNAPRGGGLIGTCGNTMTSCFWDTQTSGKNIGVGSGFSGGLIGKSTQEMKTLSTFAAAGWDIADINGIEKLWIMPGNDYPRISSLYWTYPADVALPGDGSQADPYQIWTNEEFVTLTNSGSIWNKYFILMDDLDLSGVFFRPIGNSIARFTGSFDGQGFTIANAKMNFPQKDYVGLFGFAGENASIKNLNIEDADITGGKYVGALAGNNYFGQISNCSVTGTINALASSSFIGGIAGFSAKGSISNCSCDVTINGCGSTAGGLAGVNAVANAISNCSAAGKIIDTDPYNFGSCSGGLAGTNSFGTIANSSSSVDVNSTSASSLCSVNAGALAGTNYGKISNCFATGKVSINSTSACLTAGGLVGANALGDVNDCYAAGDVSFDPNGSDGSANFAGGLVGINYEAAVKRCYSKGLVGGGREHQNDPNTACTGGLAGLNMNGNISASFWDLQTSGKNTSAGGKGLTSLQMKTMPIFQMAGWAGHNWLIDDTNDCPHFAWENTSGVAIAVPASLPYLGCGTAADPYQISSPNDFAILSWYSSALDKHFVLTEDIDLQNIMIYPIGDLGTFSGTFDGKGHVIRNAVIVKPADSYVGLFSHVAQGAVITALGIEDANIIGGDYAGILIADDQGANISECYATGRVDGFVYVGGLVGRKDGGTLERSYSIAKVTTWEPSNALAYAGGLAGCVSNNCSIINCYARSDVQGNSYAGGIAGTYINSTVSPTIRNCYAAGPVKSTNTAPLLPPGTTYYYAGGIMGGLAGPSFTNCFWDTEVCGTTKSAGGVGKASLEMKVPFTGWDFTGVWKVCTGRNYPRLAWQMPIKGDLTCPQGIDYQDFSVMARAWYSQHGNSLYNPACDISQPADNIVNELDLAQLAANWLNGI